MPALSTDNLSKTYYSHKKAPGVIGAVKGLFSREYTEVHAVQDINLSIEQGELVGFLGPNGAGKTTTLKMLSGILYPTTGKATVLGYDPTHRRQEMLQKIALVMGNKMQLWWDLPAWESFLVLRELYEVDHARFKKRIDHLIDILDLKDKINIQVRKLSLGERMKCELAAALLHTPQVVFLDEPTIGLDVISQKRIRDFLKETHAEDNCTILLTSHYMQDVQEVCKRVIVIDHGKLIFDGTLQALSSLFGDHRRVRLVFSEPVSQDDLTKFGRVLPSDDENAAIIEVQRIEAPKITSAILQQFPVMDLSVQDIDIEDIIREMFTQKK